MATSNTTKRMCLQLYQQAKAFQAGSSSESPNEILQSICNLMKNSNFNFVKITSEDFESFGYQGQIPPVAVRTFHETPEATVIAFYLRGARFKHSYLPLHDHPNMHGFIRAIQGSIRIRSYTLLEDYGAECSARFEGEQILSESDSKCIMLQPKESNIHEIMPIGDEPVGFMDVLTPSYFINDDDSVDINYFEVHNQNSDDAPKLGDRVKLRKISEPSTYWTHSF